MVSGLYYFFNWNYIYVQLYIIQIDQIVAFINANARVFIFTLTKNCIDMAQFYLKLSYFSLGIAIDYDYMLTCTF